MEDWARMPDKPKNRRPPRHYTAVGELVRMFRRGPRWYANYQFLGKQYRIALKTKSAKEARRLALRLEDELLQGKHQRVTKPPTIEVVIDAYEKFLRTEGRAAKTLKKYGKVFERIAALADKRRARTILELNLRFADAYRQDRVEANAAPKTVYTEAVILRQLVNFALSRSMISADPLKGLRLKKPKAAPQPCWTREQVEMILGKAKQPYRAVFIVLADTGMRIGELIFLTWNDIDLDNDFIHIRAKEGWRPKTGDQRAIPMKARVRELLQSAARHHRWVFTAVPSKCYPDGGRQMSERRVLAALKRILKPLGLDGHLHTFRHSFISHALMSGTPEAIVRQWVGHVDAEVLKLYTHIHDAASQAAMQRLAQAEQQFLQQGDIRDDSLNSKCGGSTPQTEGGWSVMASPSQSSGEGGILFARFSYRLISHALALQVYVAHALTALWLIAVVSGCLGLFGNSFSTISAQRKDSPKDCLPLPPIQQVVIRRARPSQPGRGQAQGENPAALVTCASYSRYSSDAQREASIADQQRTCREGADRNGHLIAPDLEFFDEAVSGTKLHRKGLDAMLAAAEAGRFQVLYFHSLSRLARESVITMPMLKKLVYVHGIRIISVTEGIDSDRDGWDVMATIFSVMHERYIKELSANVFRGQEGTVLAGFCVGDYCFGYTSVPIPGSEQGRRGRHAKPRMTYVIDEATAPWVTRIFHWFTVEKRAVRWIARELNRLNAPKDHRATTKNWHHQLVTELLKNKKYVGVWPWGEKKNVRNPLTGQVVQEDRPSEESEQWTRDLQNLRLISNEMFEAAAARLAENAGKVENRRRPNGTLTGSRTGNATSNPQHLLSRLLRCEECRAALRVCGAKGNYLGCPNWGKGVCGCKTMIPRERAERLILEAVAQRVFTNPSWKEEVHKAALAQWREQEHQQPAELQQVENALAEVDRRIGRLLDSIENGEDAPDVRTRLAERRAERASLVRKRGQLQRSEPQPREEPTMAWVEQKLTQLADLLRGGGPAAALALRNLVGGAIDVREIREPGRERHWMQGRFVIRTGEVLQALAAPAQVETRGGSSEAAAAGEEIVIDFREVDTEEVIADQVMELYRAGLTFRQIAARVGRNRNLIKAAVVRWYLEHGLEPPMDGRSHRKRLARPTLPEELADRAKALYDQRLLLHEIAAQLGCNRDTVTAAIRSWFESRGQQVPDGRSRRKTLDRKSSTPDATDTGQDASDSTGPAA
jgi:integrase/DNA invertase Pin-like site-specific DNA recombinase